LGVYRGARYSADCVAFANGVFLGFAHIWGKSLKGKNVVRQVTAKNRYVRALAAVTDWCRDNRHQTIPDQHAHLIAMMRGHYAYYGITGNFRRLAGTPIKSGGSGRNGCRGGIAEAGSCGAGSMQFSGVTLCR
jgi:hypothetical protein